MAIALDMQKGISHKDSNIIEFSVIDIASTIGWDSGVVKSHLKTLEWTTGGKNSIKFRFSGNVWFFSSFFLIHVNVFHSWWEN